MNEDSNGSNTSDNSSSSAGGGNYRGMSKSLRAQLAKSQKEAQSTAPKSTSTSRKQAHESYFDGDNKEDLGYDSQEKEQSWGMGLPSQFKPATPSKKKKTAGKRQYYSTASKEDDKEQTANFFKNECSSNCYLIPPTSSLVPRQNDTPQTTDQNYVSGSMMTTTLVMSRPSDLQDRLKGPS